jgi:hypothetical protein
MEKIYLIFGIVILLIICYLYQKSENFGLQEPKLQECLNNCNRRDVQMTGDYSNTTDCQRNCRV